MKTEIIEVLAVGFVAAVVLGGLLLMPITVPLIAGLRVFLRLRV